MTHLLARTLLARTEYSTNKVTHLLARTEYSISGLGEWHDTPPDFIYYVQDSDIAQIMQVHFISKKYKL